VAGAEDEATSAALGASGMKHLPTRALNTCQSEIQDRIERHIAHDGRDNKARTNLHGLGVQARVNGHGALLDAGLALRISINRPAKAE
jgi:hypothetical protein